MSIPHVKNSRSQSVLISDSILFKKDSEMIFLDENSSLHEFNLKEGEIFQTYQSIDSYGIEYPIDHLIPSLPSSNCFVSFNSRGHFPF
jgi:hypothetical protein